MVANKAYSCPKVYYQVGESTPKNLFFNRINHLAFLRYSKDSAG
jgi:hypothetical protein